MAPGSIQRRVVAACGMSAAMEEAQHALRCAEAVDASAVNAMDALLDPPTPELEQYDSFVKWMLRASVAELSALDGALTLPFTPARSASMDMGDPSNQTAIENGSPSKAQRSTKRFTSLAQAQLARAAAEADCEALADLLSCARRERDSIDERVADMTDERATHREKIALLEARITKYLQDRDLAIAEKYTLEKQIVELQAAKAQASARSAPLLLGFLAKRGGAHTATEKDVERLQKEIADTKLETALVKTELDVHHYRLRLLEKKCAELKLEIAQASAVEDDTKASLEQLMRDRANSTQMLQQVSVFSSSTSSLGKLLTLSPRKKRVLSVN